MEDLVQCVPNFSEGRDRATLEAIVAAARAVPQVRVADWSGDPDHHRMVLTLLWGPRVCKARSGMSLRVLVFGRFRAASFRLCAG